MSNKETSGATGSAGGIGTETVPGASGTGTDFEERQKRMVAESKRVAKAQKENTVSPSAPRPLTPFSDRPESKAAEHARRQGRKVHSAEVARSAESPARAPANIRTEFSVPPRRFPDEIQTATDPPLDQLVDDFPGRATPYVGEFTKEGAFTRQPTAAPAERPTPAPDTPRRERQATPIS